MKLQSYRRDDIPVLSWCTKMCEGADTISLVHGRWVEVGEEWFVEGVWNGSFGSTSGLYATVCAATGLQVVDGVAQYFSTSDTLGRIHSIVVNKTLYMSNSLAFILAETGERLDKCYLYYMNDICSITRGLTEAKRAIQLQSQNCLRLRYCCNMRVGSDLYIEEYEKPQVPDFLSFHDYRSFLSKSLDEMFRNGADPERRHRYKPIATMSRGYDSTCAATLAAEVGCREAVCFMDSADPYDPEGDAGEEIAKSLNMEAYLYDRHDYKNNKACIEAEFLACGTNGSSIFLSAAEDRLIGAILITGYHGDKVWSPNERYVSRHIKRGDPSGCDLSEYRLRIGMIHVPIPFAGCLKHPQIHRISNAKEMDPWRIGGSYDRPIPRRIIEEAGVGRREFGRKKRVMTRTLRDRAAIEGYFRDEVRAEVEAFVKDAAARCPSRAFIVCDFLHIWGMLIGKSAQLVGRMSWRLRKVIEVMKVGGDRYQYKGRDLRRFVFQWSAPIVCERYARKDNRNA